MFPFDDARVRKAVARAIDRDSIVRGYGYGEFFSKTDFLVSNTEGYDPSFRDALSYNPTAASALLDAAGWVERDSDGIRIKAGRRLSAELVTTGTERTPPDSVLATQSALNKAGFELRLKFVKSAELNQLVTAGEYDALTGGWWSAATADVLFIQYHSSQKARQNTFGQDTANLGDPTLDSLLQRARESTNASERQQLYRDAQRLLTELVPIVPLNESQHLVAYRRELRGVLFDTTHNTPILTTAWLNPK
jgi:peptide/nickel transport system substrate-binding protein